jgi:ATPase subunit of ABC transporter with duplicated ATPase domains
VDVINKERSAPSGADDVASTSDSGELLALLGPSGSGKTTLLRIIAGLERPTPAHLLFGGEDASSPACSERNVGFVFQHYALFRHMTVFDNVAFGLRVQPRAHTPDEAQIRAARRNCSIWCSSIGSKTATRASFPAASASASRWPARSRSSRACCCSTSRSARSTPRCARNCAAGCASSTTTGTPRCSSPTTRKRRSKSPTASW